ncbi:MAG: 50S ribosomal protein L15 [Planctomycetes bacterium]|nr:50S ribosomal protein L15 [Planctomycetota bacterium]
MNLKDVKSGLRLGKSRKRVGRGIGSGLGKTSGRGHKGLKSRKGSSVSLTYEGGQSPLFMRTAKRGFSNARYKKDYEIVNLSQLELFEDGAVVCVKDLQAKGWVGSIKLGVKVLGEGGLSKKLTVKAQSFSKKARETIEALGGVCEEVSLLD